MNSEQSSEESASQETEPEPEHDYVPKISLRAERSGIGSLLSSLRGDKLASEISRLSTSPTPVETEREEQTFVEQTEVNEVQEEVEEEESSRPLNRKEKRRLQRLEELEQCQPKKKALEVVEIAQIPTELKQWYCDNTTFNSYEATFGYKSTRTNNFVHFSLQNNDGTRAIVASQDRYIRVYRLDEPEIQWKHNTGGLILDACWETSGKGVFSTSKLRPIQLFEAESGTIIGAYNGKDSGDNIKEAMCIGQVGNTLIGGFKNQFQLWDIGVTGDAMSKIKSFDKNYSSGITGNAMSIHCHPTMPDLFAAAGSSSLLGIFSIKWANAVSTMEGSIRGYTNVQFSPDGLKLYASERSGDIHCFDTRMNMMTQILKRNMKTSHRTRFDIDKTGRLLFTGTSTGDVVVYDLHDFNEEIQPVLIENVASRCVPCVSVRNNKLVLCSGERSFPDDPILKEDDVEKEEDALDTSKPENSFQILEIL